MSGESGESGEVMTVEMLAAIEPDHCFRRIFCSAATGRLGYCFVIKDIYSYYTWTFEKNEKKFNVLNK